MGKLADFMAMKRDLASDYERELRAVRNLILGVTRLSGSEHTIDLMVTEGFVANGRARAAFVEALRASMHEALIHYAHDLAREGLDQGMDQDIVGLALSGGTAQEPVRPQAAATTAPAPAAEGVVENPPIRLAACA
jgi:hypothetical protein